MLNILLGETEGISTSRNNRNQRGRGGPPSRYNSFAQRTSNTPSNNNKPTGSKEGEATSVIVGTTRGPIVLIPEPRRKWIIAKASAEDLKQIKDWVSKLDREEPVESEYEVVQLRYADPREVADSIEQGFGNLPGTEFLPNILVQPLTETKQVIVLGRKDLREIVKKMITELDIPPGNLVTEHIKLKHADPDMVKDKLDELYQQGIGGSSSSRFGFYGGYNPYSRGRSGSSQSSDLVKVVAYSTLKEVTVIASPENMEEIKKRIAEWDVPLDIDSVKPRIIELHNCDPVEMANLLTSIFSEGGSSSSSSSNRGMNIFRGMFASQLVDQEKIVGPLYGQLTFEDVPGTKKIIVVSKIPEAYDVIESLIKELDKEEMAEIPEVVTLKYADPEKLSEILNAMFAEAGTTAVLRRSDVGLSQYSMDATQTTSSTSNNNSSTSQGQYTPPWTSAGARRTVDEQMPISNVIGRIRFVPEPRTKSILVLSPPEFIEQIKKLIDKLDVPGKQVMIKAIIVEVDHSNMTSLGIELSPTSSAGLAFGNYDENTAAIVNQLSYMETHGAWTFTASTDVTAMIDFLAKKTHAKVLNQQTLWTEDNEEASFFKGDNVAFLTSVQAATGVAGATQNIEFSRVGMTLAVRPSITPYNDVDMIINIIISQLTSEEQNGQPVRTEMETKTNMIVEDGQTIMLGGILFQQDRTVDRGVPIISDIPLLGLLFSHTDVVAANNEMLVFITPYVIDEPEKTTPATKQEMDIGKKKLDEIRQGLDTTMEKLNK
jgi:general secretion pathway protein D